VFIKSRSGFLIIVINLAILALAMSICAWLMPQFPGDLGAILWIQSFNNETLTSVMEWVSFLVSGWRGALLVCGISLVILWKIGFFEAFLFPLAGVLWLSNELLKYLIDRPRPSPDQVLVLAQETNAAFPSGHSFFAMLILGLQSYFIFIKLRTHYFKILLITFLALLILLVGLSRVYLGAHWPSDVIGGYVFGGLVTAILLWFYQTRLQNR
jgi:undecaprenyl-diphosphatase